MGSSTALVKRRPVDIARDVVDGISEEAIAPVMDVLTAVALFKLVRNFIDFGLEPKTDYGRIPGTPKDSLLLSGAEKLCVFLGLRPRTVIVDSIEDWSGEAHNREPFFYYKAQSSLFNPRGELVCVAEGSCNSWETKYRLRYVPRDRVPPHLDADRLPQKGGTIFEFQFALDKKETTGQYGKPADYWQTFEDAIAAGTATAGEREVKSGKRYPGWFIDTTVYGVPNTDIYDQVHTIQSQAAKRAFVAATRRVAAASGRLSQDLDVAKVEDQGLDAYIEAEFTIREEESLENGKRRLVRELTVGLDRDEPLYRDAADVASGLTHLNLTYDNVADHDKIRDALIDYRRNLPL
jgi:hypothetical protein